MAINKNKTSETTDDEHQTKKTVARGKSIERTEEELDDMTSPEAMAALMGEAAADFRENAPVKYRTLLDSEAKE